MKTYNHFYTAKISNYLGQLMGIILPIVFVFCFFASSAVVMAQDEKVVTSGSNNPIHNDFKGMYKGIKYILLASAEKVPEKYYRFKPTKVVRNYGQIIGHIADSNLEMCSIALGEKYVETNIAETKTSKADLIAALKESFEPCDRAFDGLTDESASQIVKFMGRERTQLGVLGTYLVHSTLHYGNLITYMRLKNIVPPTSEPDFFEKVKK